MVEGVVVPVLIMDLVVMELLMFLERQMVEVVVEDL